MTAKQGIPIILVAAALAFVAYSLLLSRPERTEEVVFHITAYADTQKAETLEDYRLIMDDVAIPGRPHDGRLEIYGEYERGTSVRMSVEPVGRDDVGYVPQRIWIDEESLGLQNEISVIFLPRGGPSTTRVQVTVRDARGVPIEGVEITVDGVARSLTDFRGDCVLRIRADTTAVVKAVHKDWTFVPEEATVSASDPVAAFRQDGRGSQGAADRARAAAAAIRNEAESAPRNRNVRVRFSSTVPGVLLVDRIERGRVGPGLELAVELFEGLTVQATVTPDDTMYYPATRTVSPRVETAVLFDNFQERPRARKSPCADPVRMEDLEAALRRVQTEPAVRACIEVPPPRGNEHHSTYARIMLYKAQAYNAQGKPEEELVALRESLKYERRGTTLVHICSALHRTGELNAVEEELSQAEEEVVKDGAPAPILEELYETWVMTDHDIYLRDGQGGDEPTLRQALCRSIDRYLTKADRHGFKPEKVAAMRRLKEKVACP